MPFRSPQRTRSKNGKAKVPLELPRYVCTFIEILSQNTSLKKFQTFSNTSNSVLCLSIPLSLPALPISKESWVEIPQPGRFIVPFIPSRPRCTCVSSSCTDYARPYIYKRLTEGEHLALSRITGFRSNPKYCELTSRLAILPDFTIRSGNSVN